MKAIKQYFTVVLVISSPVHSYKFIACACAIRCSRHRTCSSVFGCIKTMVFKFRLVVTVLFVMLYKVVLTFESG